MSGTPITTGIDQVVLAALPAGAPLGAAPRAGWRATFRSDHAGLCHQLYLNGRLVDWTDDPRGRSFFLPPTAVPVAVCIAAVAAADRATDLGAALPEAARRPGWVHRLRLVRAIANRRGDVAEVLGDHATGRLSPVPLATAELWPAWATRWAFGEDRFGIGGFGHDGTLAPGLGRGAFGAGSFGMDAEAFDLDVALPERGAHTLVVRTRSADGRTRDGTPIMVASAPPPAPPAGLRVADYDAAHHLLTLELS